MLPRDHRNKCFRLLPKMLPGDREINRDSGPADSQPRRSRDLKGNMMDTRDLICLFDRINDPAFWRNYANDRLFWPRERVADFGLKMSCLPCRHMDLIRRNPDEKSFYT